MGCSDALIVRDTPEDGDLDSRARPAFEEEAELGFPLNKS